MQLKISTDIGILFLRLISKLPFVFIYFLSDVFYFIVYYLIKYRKNVVLQNLKNSFPEKSHREIIIIRKKYFKHFCDLIFESIKMLDMKKSDYEKRMLIKNSKSINHYFEKGKSVAVLTMHYNNWEWTSCLPREIKHRVIGVYKPLHNKKFDVLINSSRKKQGAEMVSNSNVLRRIIRAEQKKEPVFVGLGGDQTPPFFHSLWYTFLNQETMFYPGPASIPKRFNHPVFFQIVEKISRGKYATRFELLVENPQDFSEKEIMKIYIQKMEEIISENPEFYLWSHNRWKHKRPENVPLQN
ncbi:lysophospholipid acyltransferase family protein [Maribellus maritimus]|uniref:lysophospholipid acyltransferase family protein n=1 Tax=Maribellus maritimus TaxID=2870838 RepID=UPI001EEA0710|nr:lysophospholipid acyltransferase family protein [Maribellus maritimus]MCG6186487.1 lysophospholipid acyltransferase family protein [Maribellus maritimus]